jgi:hypothetical protein
MVQDMSLPTFILQLSTFNLQPSTFNLQLCLENHRWIEAGDFLNGKDG